MVCQVGWIPTAHNVADAMLADAMTKLLPEAKCNDSFVCDWVCWSAVHQAGYRKLGADCHGDKWMISEFGGNQNWLSFQVKLQSRQMQWTQIVCQNEKPSESAQRLEIQRIWVNLQLGSIRLDLRWNCDSTNHSMAAIQFQGTKQNPSVSESTHYYYHHLYNAVECKSMNKKVYKTWTLLWSKGKWSTSTGSAAWSSTKMFNINLALLSTRSLLLILTK